MWSAPRHCMKPPSDRQLDLYGSGTDVPAPPRVNRGVRWQLIFVVATALGLLSTALAWQFTRWLGKMDISWPTLAILNYAYWYLWALMAPAIIWLSLRFRFERGGLVRALLVHIPCVVAAAFTHIAAMEAVQWWMAFTAGRPFAWWTEVQRSMLHYFDWEMITYWAIVGLSHALLYYRESRGRAVRAAQLEVKLAEAQLSTLQQQLHPHFLFNTLHAISALMHRDVEAADRTLMGLERSPAHHAREPRTVRDHAQVRAGFPLEVSANRADPIRRSADRAVRRPAGHARHARAEHAPAATRRERDQARRGQEGRPRPHRYLRPPRRRQAPDRGSRRWRGVVRRCAHRAAERDRRVHDAGASAAPVWRRLSLRVPSPRPGSRRHRRCAVAYRAPGSPPVATSAPPSAETRQRSVFSTFSSMAGAGLWNTSLFRRKTS